MKSNISFKARLEKLLGKRIKQAPDGKVDFDALLGRGSTYLDLILVAQIKKASAGDTSSASFLRDTSGNKLKDKAEVQSDFGGAEPFDLV